MTARFKTDGGGLAFTANDAKLQVTGGTGRQSASTWATKFSHIAHKEGVVRIITFSLPDVEYVRTQLGRRPRDIFIVAGVKFTARAREIRRAFPGIRIALNDEVHSKVLLIEPHLVVISSANFGKSGWHETAVSFHSREAHDWYVEQSFVPLWEASQELDDEAVGNPFGCRGGHQREG